MSQFIYDIYSVSTKDKSKKQINKLLKAESKSYAYLADKHISFFSRSGISYADGIIDALKQDSFIYLTSHQSGKVYLLIYINQEISYCGLLFSSEVQDKLALYQQAVNDNISVYSYECNLELKLEQPLSNLPEKFNPIIENNKYRLKSAQQILKSKQTIRKATIRLLAIAIITTLATGYYMHYQKQIAAQKVANAQKKVIDIWRPYRQAAQFPTPSVEINNFTKELLVIRSLPQCAINNFNYQNGELQIKMANFGYPVQRLQTWSKKNELSLSDVTSESFSANYYIANNNIKHGKEIMSVQELQYWIMDKLSHSFNSSKMDLQFSDSAGGAGDSNFKKKDFSISLTKFPVKLLASAFASFDKYPIKLVSINGSVTLANLNGKITFQIIGE